MKNIFLMISFLFLVFSTTTTVAQNSDAEMQEILQRKRAKNLNTKIEGYRIQIYYGMSEEKAKGFRNQFAAIYPEVYTKLFYKQPEWKVHIGNFQTKLEAEKMLAKIREEFGNAFVLQTEIQL